MKNGESASQTVMPKMTCTRIAVGYAPRSGIVTGVSVSAVVYVGGHQVNIPAESVDDAFAARLIDFMQKMTSPVPPRRVPSGPECGFCELTKGDCSERVDAGVDAA